MPKVEFHDERCDRAIEKATGREGELYSFQRVVERGKGATRRVIRTHEAIFTFDDPMFCPLADMPIEGGFFLTEDGEAEVTQLILRFDTKQELGRWLEANFDLEVQSSE